MTASSIPELNEGDKFVVLSIFFSFLWHLTVAGNLKCSWKGSLPLSPWCFIPRVRRPVCVPPPHLPHPRSNSLWTWASHCTFLNLLPHSTSSLRLFRPFTDHFLSHCQVKTGESRPISSSWEDSERRRVRGQLFLVRTLDGIQSHLWPLFLVFTTKTVSSLFWA